MTNSETCKAFRRLISRNADPSDTMYNVLSKDYVGMLDYACLRLAQQSDGERRETAVVCRRDMSLDPVDAAAGIIDWRETRDRSPRGLAACGYTGLRAR
jgi:hypothetical protein